MRQDKWRSAETSEALQGKPVQEHRSLSVGFYLYSFQTPQDLSSTCLSKTSSQASASAEYPLIRQLLEKQPMMQLGRQRNQKFPSHPAKMQDSELVIRGFPAVYKAFEQGTRESFTSGAILYGSIERIIQEVHSEQPSHLANCHRAVTSS